MGNEGRIRTRIIEALQEGRVQHEMLTERVSKNELLQSGQVGVQEVLEFLKPSRGLRFETRPHPVFPKISTYIFRSDPTNGGLPVTWYVKCYCLSEAEEENWFVGVHLTPERKPL